MRINSKFFVLFLAALTVLLCFLMLWLWKRLSRRSAAAVLGRVALVVSSQLAMTATILAAVNIYFGFYTSWQDLLGGGAQNYQLHVQPPPSIAKFDAAQLSGGGTALALHGLRSGISADLTVFVPPGYQDTSQQHTRYPTIVIDDTGLVGAAPKGFGVHAADVPALLVYVTSASVPAIPCTDISGVPGQQGALFWDQDLRTAIATRYRVDLAPENWGVVGIGGNAACAGTLAVLGSAYYGAAATWGTWTEPADLQDPSTAAVTPAQWLKLYPGPPSSLLLVDPDEQTKAVFSGDVGRLRVTFQSRLDLDQMLAWLTQATGGEGAGQWA